MSNKGINKVILIGYVGQDPEVRYTSNGGVITIISLATSDNWKNKKTGEIKEKTEWHRIIFFGKIAELSSEFLKKGHHLYIEGKLQTRKWKDNNDIERYITEIIVGINGIMKILNTKVGNFDIQKNNNINEKSNEFNIKNNDFIDEDIPF